MRPGAYNKVIPPQGEAQQAILQARYSLNRVNHAEGDAARFNSLSTRAKLSEVTRRRMYLETMQKVLPRLSSWMKIAHATPASGGTEQDSDGRTGEGSGSMKREYIYLQTS